MKSIKPGRGPSMLDGVMSIAVGIFGIFWTILAINMGAGFMAIFGIIFVLIAIIQAVYNLKNATSENRYSKYDIVDEWEEKDTFNERFGKNKDSGKYGSQDFSGQSFGRSSSDKDIFIQERFCPYCGTKVAEDYVFCSKCGKKLP